MVGYCIVYGGEKFILIVCIDEEVLVEIESLFDFVLFYNLAGVIGI